MSPHNLFTQFTLPCQLSINATALSSNDEQSLVKYLHEPQSFKAVLKLDDDVRNAWLQPCYQYGNQELNGPRCFHIWQNTPQR
jgi:hypothetical protein